MLARGKKYQAATDSNGNGNRSQPAAIITSGMTVMVQECIYMPHDDSIYPLPGEAPQPVCMDDKTALTDAMKGQPFNVLVRIKTPSRPRAFVGLLPQRT